MQGVKCLVHCYMLTWPALMHCDQAEQTAGDPTAFMAGATTTTPHSATQQDIFDPFQPVATNKSAYAIFMETLGFVMRVMQVLAGG